jgi:hypothetical protein
MNNGNLMMTMRLAVVLLGLSLLCHGCARAPAAMAPSFGRAKLAVVAEGICQQRNGLMWQLESSGVLESGQQAVEYVQALRLGNYSDWRLPSKGELYALCYLHDLKLTGDCPLKPTGSYWSMNGAPQAGEWEVYSLCGGTEYQYRGSKAGRVRAVRP